MFDCLANENKNTVECKWRNTLDEKISGVDVCNYYNINTIKKIRKVNKTTGAFI